MSKITIEIADLIKNRWRLADIQLAEDPLGLYLDSLDRLELVMYIEKMYGISIEVGEEYEWTYLSDVVRCVYKKVVENESKS